MLNLIVAILVFGLIVFIHELGHFLLAKANKIGVVEFSIGMGPRLFSFVKGDTRYSVKAFPIGGSCMMLGEDTDEYAENAFQNKPVLGRILTIAAGPVFNFILAYILAVILVSVAGFDKPVIMNVTEGTPAWEAGLRSGDLLTGINGKKIYSTRELSIQMMVNPGDGFELQYETKPSGTGEVLEKKAFLVPQFVEADNVYRIGIEYRSKYETESIFDTLKSGVYELRVQFLSTIEGFKMIFQGKVKPQDAVAGPIQMLDIIGGVVEESKGFGMGTLMLTLMNLSMILSISLGFMNLLPFPALDGGRLVFLLIEAVRGKPVDREKEGMVHMAGFMVLMALMVLVLFNDLRKIF